MRRVSHSWLLTLPLLWGCATGPRASLPDLHRRAVYDLGCDGRSLRLDHVDARTKVVSGCGRRLIYMEDCLAVGTELLCSWRLDTPTAAQLQWPVTAAAPAAPPPTRRAFRTSLDDEEGERLLEPRNTPASAPPYPRPPSDDVLQQRR